ncbi:MAG: phospholipase D family protein [Pseudomonadales bacterium]
MAIYPGNPGIAFTPAVCHKQWMHCTLRTFFVCWALVGAAACTYLPRLDDSPVSQALPAQAADRIAAALPLEGGDVQRCLLLDTPGSALEWRLALIDAADRSIDAQYYVWEGKSGNLLIDRVLAAADRGVRVRILVDDIHIDGFREPLLALDEHPNLEIRIFNPFGVRIRAPFGAIRLLEMAVDGNRLNHRMHNKVLMVDGRVAVFGGRNIGDAYYAMDDELNFLDMDVVFKGAAVADMATGFDLYWNSRWSYPVTAIEPIPLFRSSIERIQPGIRRQIEEDAELSAYAARTDWVPVLRGLDDGVAVDGIEVIYDLPEVGWFQHPEQMADRLAEVGSQIQRSVQIVSPYLVPTQRQLELLEALRARDVRVSVLTNSLASNDVTLANAAYSKYRQQLLEAGVELYELRPDAQLLPATSGAKRSRRLSLHRKFMIFDDDLVYVGSMNLDPRSVTLNTELGALIRSTALAETLRRSFAESTASDNAWRVTLDDGVVHWRAGAEVSDREPSLGLLQRLANWFYKLLPVSRQV